jgi:hypothetical protein
MVHAAGEHDGDDFHVVVAMQAEAIFWLNEIVVEDTQQTEAFSGWVVIIGEAEAEITFQPANVFYAAFLSFIQ